jgi:hypothetical protein
MLSTLSLEGNNARANTMIDTSDRVATTDTTVSGADRRDGTRSGTINYDAQRMIGHGSFGAGNFS